MLLRFHVMRIHGIGRKLDAFFCFACGNILLLLSSLSRLELFRRVGSWWSVFLSLGDGVSEAKSGGDKLPLGLSRDTFFLAQ